MRIAHLSDLHLGQKSPGDPYGAERLNSFRHGISKLTEESPDVIVVAGDIFDSPGVDGAIVQEAAKTLQRARDAGGKAVPIVVIPGNHDPSDSERLWSLFEKTLGKNSSVYLVLRPEAIPVGNGKMLMEAYPCETRYSPESPWARRLNLTKDAKSSIRMVVAHGTLQGGPVPEGESEAYPFTQSDIDSLDADYVALGHFHCLYPSWQSGNEIERSFCYSGTHEPNEFGQDSGWIVIAIVEKGKPTRLRRIQVGSRQWRLVAIINPMDVAKLDSLRAEVESESDPRKYVIRLKVGSETRLSPTEVDKLCATEASLLALGAYVERQGEFSTYINVESLDLSALPSGAVKQVLHDLQIELAQTTDKTRREVLATALQLGWQRFRD